MAKVPDHDPSIFNEPYLRGETVPPEGGECSQPERQSGPNRRRLNKLAEEQAEHTVWDEPDRVAGELLGGERPGLTWRQWYLRRREETPAWYSWMMVMLLGLAAGPFAVLAALITGMTGGIPMFALIYVVAAGPMIEEVVKTALIAWLVERKPWLLRSRFQIVLMALAGSLCFAVIENLMYLKVYIPDPAPALASWRWTVCTTMHASCSTIAALGLMRLWREVYREEKKASMSGFYPYLALAVMVHGGYNAAALIMERLNLVSF